jgi:uncharacterized protein YdhG (YjbR/CyaY superfamily)
MKKAAKLPKTIDDYLAPLDPIERDALQKLRRDVHAAAPGAIECISYGIPAFRLNGRMLVAFGAAAKHVSFYPGAVVQDFKALLKGYSTSKGTLRFDPEKPLPATLVRKLVMAGIARMPKTASKRRQKTG